MKKITTIKIDWEVWKEARKFCVENGLTFSEFVEKTIKEKLNI